MLVLCAIEALWVFLPVAFSADALAASNQTAPPTAANTPSIANFLSSSPAKPISANPAAIESIPGNGAAGRLIGLDQVPGMKLSGLWIGNADYLTTGGVDPRSSSFNSLTVVNLNLDFAKMARLAGSELNASMLWFDGEPANRRAGVVPGYDGLTGPKPLNRTELYELWWKQGFFHNKFILKIGKSVTTNDFNKVSQAIPTSDSSLHIPAVTALLYTAIFKNPTMIGAAPGYYNSAYGVVARYVPSQQFYLSYGLYDGALAEGTQTGLQEAPVLDGHYFMIGEAGYAWDLSGRGYLGNLATGGWAQTGELHGPDASQDGAEGFYMFGSQRLWRAHPDIDNSGISGFFQFGVNDSRTMIANEFFGIGFTGFGLIPRRLADSTGIGLAWSGLNRRFGFRSNEAMLQAYHQISLIGSTYLEPAVSYIPNPGHSPSTEGAVALTAQLTILF